MGDEEDEVMNEEVKLDNENLIDKQKKMRIQGKKIFLVWLVISHTKKNLYFSVNKSQNFLVKFLSQLLCISE